MDVDNGEAEAGLSFGVKFSDQNVAIGVSQIYLKRVPDGAHRD